MIEQLPGPVEQQVASGQAEQATDSMQQQGAGQQEARAGKLKAKLLRGEQPSAAELLPHTTAWKDKVAELVGSLVRAVRQLGAAPPPAGAAQRDVQLLEAVIAELPPGEQRTAVQVALEGARKFGKDGVPPQAVVLATNHKLEYGVACTPLLASDPELQPYLELFSRAFQHSIDSAALRQHRDSLADLQEVQLQAVQLQEAAPAAKKPKPFRILRQKMAVVWSWLQPRLDELGELCQAGHRGVGMVYTIPA